MADFEYRSDGVFMALLPQNYQAASQWQILAASEHGAHGKVFLSHWKAVKLQLEKCGYTLSKAKKPGVSSAIDDDLLLAELLQT